MTAMPFGEHLKREREMRGVSLEEISAATRISRRFLEALENEQWDRLPGGIFNRGFIRAVGHFLGLDEESLIAEYALETNDQPEVAVWAKSPSPERRGWLAVLLLVLLVVLAAGGWAAYRRFAPMVKAWRQPPVKVLAVPAPPVKPPADTLSTSEVSTAAAAPTQTPVPAGTGSATDTSARFPGQLELKVEAGKNVQVKVTSDGKPVFDGKLAAAETRRFQAHERFDVSASESSAVLLELDGQTVPPLGPPGQPGNVTLTRKDLKKTQGGRN